MTCDEFKGAVIALEPANNRAEKCFVIKCVAPAQRAFPDAGNAPARCGKSRNGAEVIVPVAVNFCLPEIRAGGWQAEKRAVVAMPETAMYEQDGVKTWHHDVRFAGKVADVKAETKSVAVQETADVTFWLCVRTAYAAHHAAARGRIDDVGHGARPAAISGRWSPAPAGRRCAEP